MQTQTNTDVRAGILEIMRELPDSTLGDVCALMPHVSYSAVSSTISYLKKTGVVEVSGRKSIMRSNGAPNRVSTYRLSTNPTPNVVRMKRKEPTEAGLRMQVKQLQEQIAELVAWKQEAIARFPDLAVDPVILRARELVSAEVKAGGDNALAEAVLAGRKDDTLMMRVTIKALEEAND